MGLSQWAQQGSGVTTDGDPTDKKFVVKPAEFPYFVSLKERGNCAGAIVGSHHIVTAAHCVCKAAKVDVTAVFSDGSKKAPTAAYFNPACKFHCDEDGPNRCDVAVLEFDEDIAADFETVALYKWGDEVGKDITILGFGATGDAEGGECEQPDGKMRRAVNVVTKVEGHPGGVLKYKMDSNSRHELQGMAQDGDSGGPAIIRKDGVDYLAGVNSGTSEQNPCDFGSVDQYCRISSHESFIKKVLAGDVDIIADFDFTEGEDQGDDDYTDDPKEEDDDHDDYGDDDERKFQLGQVWASTTSSTLAFVVGGASLMGAMLVFVLIRYTTRSSPSIVDAPSDFLRVENHAVE